MTTFPTNRGESKIKNISIVIPHYNKNAVLKKTWKELLLQIHPEDEILVVDDHSEVKPEFDCPCTRVIQPPKLTPHIYRLNTLRNYGVEHATHDACIILDPDCIPSVGFINHARKIYDPSILFGGRITRQNEDRVSFAEDTRMRDGESKWGDTSNHDSHSIFGGCMYFSKQRASLASSPTGLFDTDFDGNWGYEEHAFASACRNSGMRLRLEAGLTVCHQWHPHKRPGVPSRNKNTLKHVMKNHRNNLNAVTFYQPAVAVLMVSTNRPYYIDQGMRSIFRHIAALKVRLVNNGDQSPAQLEATRCWSDRWAVDYVNYKTPQLLSSIRSQAMRDYSKKGYAYLIMIDDDITPMSGSLSNLILEMEKHPQYHALSGYIQERSMAQFIGGRIEDGVHRSYSPVKLETLSADYTSSGFTIIRLNVVVPYSEGWEMGWNDWDWSNEVKKRGLQVGVTGKAGAHHKQILTSKGWIQKKDSGEYKRMRYDNQRHNRMASLFREKWGYTPKMGSPTTEIKQ